MWRYDGQRPQAVQRTGIAADSCLLVRCFSASQVGRHRDRSTLLREHARQTRQRSGRQSAGEPSLAPRALAHCAALTVSPPAPAVAAQTCVCRVWDPDTPVLVAPAMNTKMWAHPATRRHLATVREFGFDIIPPISKELACGDVGMGAMAEVDTIVSEVLDRLRSKRPMVPTAAPAPAPALLGAGSAGVSNGYAAPTPAPVQPAPAAYSSPMRSAAPTVQPHAVPGLVSGMLAAPAPTPAPTPGAAFIDTSGLAEALARVQALNQSAAAQQAEIAQAEANKAAVEAATSVLPPHMADQATMAQQYATTQLVEAQKKQKELARQQAEAFMKVAEEQLHLTGADEGAVRRRTLSAKLERYSLKAEAARKRRIRDRSESGLDTITPHMAFADSRLVKGDDAVTLFTLMPLVRPDYDGGEPSLPKCKLLFATWNNYPATLQYVARVACLGSRLRAQCV